MFEFKKVSKAELELIFRNASSKMGINEVIIEKDYWVSFVLNYLFSKSKYKDKLVFKGGTSLSKCFNLIERFSEDIDLILDWRLIDLEMDEPWERRSKTKQDKFNKECNRKMEIFLEKEFVPEILNDFKTMINDDFKIELDKLDKQTVLFQYPSTFKSTYVRQVIRLEIGTLAEWSPSKIFGINPDIQKIYPMLFQGDKIEVKSVLPERTFWEKATILHHEANRPKELYMPKRYARHYYDLYMMANSKYKDMALKNSDLLDKVVAFKEKFYPRKWAKYEEATIKEIRLIPDDYRFKEIEEDYNNMSEMFFGKYPSFKNLMQGINELERAIHEIK